MRSFFFCFSRGPETIFCVFISRSYSEDVRFESARAITIVFIVFASCRQDTDNNEASELSMKNVGGVFIVLCSGVAVAAVLASAEMFWTLWKTTSKEKVNALRPTSTIWVRSGGQIGGGGWFCSDGTHRPKTNTCLVFCSRSLCIIIIDQF